MLQLKIQFSLMIKLIVNNKEQSFDVDPSMPLLWVLRENAKLTGSKFGCGMGLCGACTMHLDGKPIRSCVTPIAAAENRAITTIEGIGNQESGLHPVQEAWIEEQVPQCGYCQSGQIMSAVALLNDNPNPDERAVEKAMNGNICRCGTYNQIKSGIKNASRKMAIENEKIKNDG